MTVESPTHRMSDYQKYRGKCKQAVDDLVAKNPQLTAVRGWYFDPSWGEQQHWWCVDLEGNIIDPTKNQFPSKGNGIYTAYNGFMPCEYCGVEVAEEDIYQVDQHTYCSYKCYGRDIGF